MVIENGVIEDSFCNSIMFCFDGLQQNNASTLLPTFDEDSYFPHATPLKVQCLKSSNLILR